jgi:hypothetical protein
MDELAETMRAPQSASEARVRAEVEAGAPPGVFRPNSPIGSVEYMYDAPAVNMFSPANQAYARAFAEALSSGATEEEAAAAGRAARNAVS